MADGYMRVAQLRELLADFPDDGLVVLSKDGEGNEYSPLADGQPAIYVPDTTWSGAAFFATEGGIYPTDTNDEGAESCVVLWPVN